MKCINCKAKAKNGYITHTRTCPDYAYPNHTTKVVEPMDVGINIFMDDISTLDCGEEHPRLKGNYCVNPMEHKEEHEDLDGNTWLGRSDA